MLRNHGGETSGSEKMKKMKMENGLKTKVLNECEKFVCES
jgi:hypothetical protein